MIQQKQTRNRILSFIIPGIIGFGILCVVAIALGVRDYQPDNGAPIEATAAVAWPPANAAPGVQIPPVNDPNALPPVSGGDLPDAGAPPAANDLPNAGELPDAGGLPDVGDPGAEAGQAGGTPSTYGNLLPDQPTGCEQGHFRASPGSVIKALNSGGLYLNIDSATQMSYVNPRDKGSYSAFLYAKERDLSGIVLAIDIRSDKVSQTILVADHVYEVMYQAMTGDYAHNNASLYNKILESIRDAANATLAERTDTVDIRAAGCILSITSFSPDFDEELVVSLQAAD